jgi:N-methylhydantoinase B
MTDSTRESTSRWSARARVRPAPAGGVALALHHGLFAACAEEMGVTLMRAAHSPNIKERLDHSCAVFDGQGRLVAQAAHIPVHLGSLPRAVAAARALGPFAPGDTVMLNDPYAGGTHLPDVTLVSPVFLGRGRGPSFFVASRAHHADIGGAAPGSMPLAREVYEEGFRIPPVFLARRGRTDRAVLDLLLANVRTPDERRADLAAQLGAQATGARRLRDLAGRGGAAALEQAAAALIAHGARVARAAVARLPRGRWRFADVLDDDGITSAPVPIQATLTLDGRRVRIDFTGSSPQTAGPVNAVSAVTFAACAYALRLVLGEVPVNHGALSVLDVVAPAGTVVNALPPAAVSAGNVETSQRIVDVVLGALARALPDRIPAASSGTMNNLLVGGWDPRTAPGRGPRSGARARHGPASAAGSPFAYYETLGGGHGAGPGWNGEHAMQAHMTNTRNTPVEALEHAYPLRVEAARIRRGSGGRGRWRGGDGIERRVRLLVPARVTVIAERRVRGPWGLAGGAPGRRGETRVASDGRQAPKGRGPATRASRPVAPGAGRLLPGKFQFDLPAGAVLTLASPGGGGFGTPARTPRRSRRTR